MMIRVIKEKMDIKQPIDDNQADALSLLYCILNPEVEAAIRHRTEMNKKHKALKRRRAAEYRRALKGS